METTVISVLLTSCWFFFWLYIQIKQRPGECSFNLPWDTPWPISYYRRALWVKISHLPLWPWSTLSQLCILSFCQSSATTWPLLFWILINLVNSKEPSSRAASLTVSYSGQLPLSFSKMPVVPSPLYFLLPWRWVCLLGPYKEHSKMVGSQV